jgi:hypothetical protein
MTWLPPQSYPQPSTNKKFNSFSSAQPKTVEDPRNLQATAVLAASNYHNLTNNGSVLRFCEVWGLPSLLLTNQTCQFPQAQKGLLFFVFFDVSC